MRDSVSKVRRLNNGLPQGSVMTPTLFNLYILDMPAIFRYSGTDCGARGILVCIAVVLMTQYNVLLIIVILISINSPESTRIEAMDKLIN